MFYFIDLIASNRGEELRNIKKALWEYDVPDVRFILFELRLPIRTSLTILLFDPIGFDFNVYVYGINIYLFMFDLQ